MGNCLHPPAKIGAQHNNSSEPSKLTSSRTDSYSPLSSLKTPSTPSTPKFTSNGGTNAADLFRLRHENAILSNTSHLKPFTLNELRSATKNFRPDSLLGEGGFGYVYKGWIDAQTLTASRPGSGMVVAVKKLKPEGFQGHKEWLTEVQYLGQLHHPNLVKLIGYCSEGENRLLVYEFMPRGSLENHLFRRGAEPLPWAVRIKVAIGAAKGLMFLHETKIIYRDLKASNILLDSEFNPKLSDFGLVKEGPTGDRTHVSTQVMGTRGYAAPEYIATGRLSSKADVYSFGVVLLELLSGRRAFEKSPSGLEHNLVDWARPYLGDKRKLFRIMDSRLEGQYPKKGAFTLASLAFNCLSNEARLRPKMNEVLAALQELHEEDHVRQRKTNRDQESSSSAAAVRKSPMRQHVSTPRQLTPMGSPVPANAYRRSPRF